MHGYYDTSTGKPFTSIPTSDFISETALAIPADLSGKVLNVQTVAFGGSVTVNRRGPRPRHHRLLHHQNPYYTKASVHLVETTRAISSTYPSVSARPPALPSPARSSRAPTACPCTATTTPALASPLPPSPPPTSSRSIASSSPAACVLLPSPGDIARCDLLDHHARQQASFRRLSLIFDVLIRS